MKNMKTIQKNGSSLEKTGNLGAGLAWAQEPTRATWLMMLAGLALCTGVLVFNGGVIYREITVVALAVLFLFLCFRRFSENVQTWFSYPLLALLLYVVWAGVGVCYALAGKLFLIEYTKLLLAFGFYTVLLLFSRDRERATRNITVLLAVGLTAISALSVAVGLSDAFRALFERYGLYQSLKMAFAENRLPGVVGAANVQASLSALGIFLSVNLWLNCRNRVGRGAAAFAAVLNGVTLLLTLSLGGIFFTVVAGLVYVFTSGRHRMRVLQTLLSLAVAAGASSLLIWKVGVGSTAFLTVLIIPLGGLGAFWLQKLLCRDGAIRIARKCLRPWVLAIPAVLVAVFLVVGLRITEPLALTETTFQRTVRLAPGSYTLTVQYQGDPVRLGVDYQTEYQVLTGNYTSLPFAQIGDGVWTFEVPQGNVPVKFLFVIDGTTTMESATLSDGTVIPLGYKLLPESIAERVRNLSTPTSMLQRLELFRNGFRLFGKSWVLGNGMGSFESGCTSVQRFYLPSKYLHNQYIQVLNDSGVIGFLLYMGAIVALLAAMWKKRKAEREGTYPMLWACMTMILLHSAMEVTMSTAVYLPFAFGIFALVTVTCGDTLALRNRHAVLAGQLGIGLSGILYAVLIVGNIVATTLTAGGTSFSNLLSAYRVDVFSGNDYAVSYVYNAIGTSYADVEENADRMANRLKTKPSNSAFPYVITYFLKTGDLDAALEAAEYALRYNWSSLTAWDEVISSFRKAFTMTPVGNPYMGPEGKELAAGVMKLYDLLEERNRECLDRAELSQENWDFTDVLKAINPALT